MSKDKIITGISIAKQKVKAQMILDTIVIPRAELFEIRKASCKLSIELKKLLKANA